MKHALAFLVLAACGAGGSGPSTDPDASTSGVLVVGVQTPELGALVNAFHIAVKHDGIVVKDVTVPISPGASTSIVQSIEVAGAVGSLVDTTVEALSPNGGPPIISRIASTHIVAGSKKLLRLRLDTRCASIPDPTGGAPIGVTCAAPLTCNSGSCVSSVVGDADLEDFEMGWETTPPPDICRPAKPGPPEVILGTGQTDYAPLADNQTLQLEQGPQGGHHIWMAVRMKNLRQSGSTTTVTSVVAEGPSPAAPLSLVFTFDRDEGSYCKVYGLRYQVDASGLTPDGTPIPAVDYHLFLGKRIVVTAEVVDSTGARASSSRTVQLADKILCADGTEACNTP